MHRASLNEVENLRRLKYESKCEVADTHFQLTSQLQPLNFKLAGYLTIRVTATIAQTMPINCRRLNRS